MLHEFLVANRDEILARSRAKLKVRPNLAPTEAELEFGLPHFLVQMTAILQAAKGERAASHLEVDASAAQHGATLQRQGLTVGQVVHDYGSICQSVTELAHERAYPITADEFQVFNRCLDDAIAGAVTEYQVQRDHAGGGPGVEHLGFLAHEMRNLLGTSMLAYEALTRGAVGIQGSTGTMLGRSLRRMRALIDRTLAEVRLGAGLQAVERVAIAGLIEEIEIVALLDARDKGVQLTIVACAPDVCVDADPQIVASVLANLVQNAFKYTPRGGAIAVRARGEADRVLIEVEDQCGGLPPGAAAAMFQPFAERSADHSGLGLGLAISMAGAKASHGTIHVRDLPGRGCVFTVDLPRAKAL